MRALLCAAVLLGGCAPDAARIRLRVGFEGSVTDHTNARQPRGFVGLRLFVITEPR